MHQITRESRSRHQDPTLKLHYHQSRNYLDGPATRNANPGDPRESIRANRFAEKPLFSQCASDSRESPQTCDSQFLAPEA